jgi:hypothetical protein
MKAFESAAETFLQLPRALARGQESKILTGFGRKILSAKADSL